MRAAASHRGTSWFEPVKPAARSTRIGDEGGVGWGQESLKKYSG